MRKWNYVGVGVAGLAGALFAFMAEAASVEPGFVSLFNGKDLSGWDGDPQFWSVSGDVIRGQTTPENPTPANTFLIWKGGEVKDFVLRLDYKVVGNNEDKWGNSGVQYRASRPDKTQWVLQGYQADIDTARFYTGILYEEGGRGILSLCGEFTRIGDTQPVRTVLPNEESTQETISVALRNSVKADDWNSYSIRVETLDDGSTRFTHTINGQLMTYAIDASDVGAKSGLVGLQLHAGKSMTVEFKNIRIKQLKR